MSDISQSIWASSVIKLIIRGIAWLIRQVASGKTPYHKAHQLDSLPLSLKLRNRFAICREISRLSSAAYIVIVLPKHRFCQFS